MRNSSYHILRVGLAITFLWIGILILKDPLGWSGFIKPWAQALLPGDPVQMMIMTGFLDMAVGFFLLLDTYVWIAAFVGTAHLMIVLTVSGIDELTVRDIGLLAGTISLFWTDAPARIKSLFHRGPKPIPVA